jgi:hypothetical protein
VRLGGLVGLLVGIALITALTPLVALASLEARSQSPRPGTINYHNL